MKVADQNNLRERIYSMLGRRNRQFVLHHFLCENINRRTIYNVFKRYYKGLPAQGKKKPGRKTILNKKQLEKLAKTFKNNLGSSNRVLGRKFQISKETVRQNLNKMGIKYHKRAIVPRYSLKQLEEIPRKCRKLRREFLHNDVTLIIDDEKYFTFSWSAGEQNAGYYTDEVANTPDYIRFSPKAKFEPSFGLGLHFKSWRIRTVHSR